MVGCCGNIEIKNHTSDKGNLALFKCKKMFPRALSGTAVGDGSQGIVLVLQATADLSSDIRARSMFSLLSPAELNLLHPENL